MAKVKLKDMNFGLEKKPEINLEHDAKTLLETAFDREKGEYKDIPINKISKNPNNDYAEADTDGQISELAADIKRNGLLHNIVVLAEPDGSFLLLSGERRLRAYEYLLKTNLDNKYSIIHAKILKNLSETEQMIILDAANLHTRGGIGGETKFRKAMVRFVKNLQSAGKITESEAKKITAETFESIDKRLIDNNLTIENNLIPEMKALLDSDLIPKRQAILYARLENDVQREIAGTIKAANEKGRGVLNETNDRLKEAMKQVVDLTAQIKKHEKGISEVEDEIKEAEKSLKRLETIDNDVSPLKEAERYEIEAKIKALTDEKRRFSAAINQARAALAKNRSKMTETPKKAAVNAVAAQINKNVNKVVSSVNTVSSLHSIGSIRAMDEAGKKVAVERLKDALKRLSETILSIEGQTKE